MISFYILLGIFVFQLLVIVLLGLFYSKKDETVIKGSIRSLAIIVPFRNEATRIGPLIQSINEQNIPEGLSLQFIFVDDDSTDKTAELINSKLKKQFVTILSPGNGKKAAIAYGILESKADYILTWDADIELPASYFSAISSLSEADLWILPVVMTSRTILERLGAVEFQWMQILTRVSCRLGKPMMSNGANLLFKKSAYLSAQKKRNDEHIPSGDDMFLLHALAKDASVIKASSKSELRVRTVAPITFKQLYFQRKRWAGKMNALLNWSVLAFGLIILLMLAAFIASLYLAISQVNPIYLIPIGLKMGNEYLLTRIYKRAKDLMVDFPLTVLHNLFYPVFLFSLIFRFKLKEKRWADRDLNA